MMGKSPNKSNKYTPKSFWEPWNQNHLQSAPTASWMDLKPSLSKYSASSAYKTNEDHNVLRTLGRKKNHLTLRNAFEILS